jgi:hypothetical protein
MIISQKSSISILEIWVSDLEIIMGSFGLGLYTRVLTRRNTTSIGT